MSQTGPLDAAVKMVEQVILDADPEQKELHARAYNALGNCYQRAGQTTDALLAYLHVDVLYSSVPDAHAEALANLVPLWQSIGQDARRRGATMSKKSTTPGASGRNKSSVHFNRAWKLGSSLISRLYGCK